MAVAIRRELEQLNRTLDGISTTLNGATREEDPALLTVCQCKILMRQLESTRDKMDSAILRLATLGEEGEDADEDIQSEARMNLKWEQLYSLLQGIMTAEHTTQLSTKLHNSIRKLERLREANPDKDCKLAAATLNAQLVTFGQALEGAILPEGTPLRDEYESYEERILNLLMAEPAPPDHKDMGMVHGKGNFKVSPLSVPKFDGKLTSWVAFWQEYEMAIHTKKDMLDNVKLVYLKQAIQDSGLQTTIADLGIEDGSYAKAIALLHTRYQKPRVMHRLFSEELRELKSKSKAGLHQLADSAQHILLGFTRLKKLGVSEVITSSIESVMGPELREHWLNFSESFKETPPAEKIIDFIRMRADREEGINLSRPHHNEQRYNKSKPAKKKGLVAGTPVASQPAVASTPSTAPRVAPSGTYNPSQKREFAPCKYDCSLCHEKHYCYHCSKFKAFTPKQRREHVTANNLCINCLKPNHTVEQCRSIYKCSVCNQKHNSMVHDEGTTLSSPALGLASATAIIPDGLLMTATVLVNGSNGFQTTARAFIDCGSTVTLISNKLKNALSLDSIGQHTTVDGVAGFVGQTQHPVVQLTLSSPKDKKWERQITAVVLPKVIRDLPLRDASSTLGLPHLQNLELADPLYHKVGPIDMLLGLDVFPYIFGREKREGPPNTPVAWDTVFGWTVLGMYSLDGCKKAIQYYTEDQSPGAQLVALLYQAEDQRNLESTMQPKEEEKVAARVTQEQPILIEKGRFQVALTKTSEDPVLEESRGQTNEEALVEINEWSESRPAIEECVLLKHAVATSPPDEDSSPSSSQAFQDLASSINHSQTLAILPKQSQTNLEQNILKTATAKPQENFTDQKLFESRRDEKTTQVKVPSSCASNERGVAVDIAGTIDASSWLSCFTLEMKTLHGSCWKQKIGWEQAIPQKKLNNCKTRSKDKPLLADIRLPRHFYLGRREIEVTLHGFSNINEKTSSAVEYLRAAHESGPQTSTLVCFKTTVAFLDLKSILELELDGAHHLTKILKEVSSTLGITTSHTMAPADITTSHTMAPADNTSALTLPISTKQNQILQHLPLRHDPLRLEKEPLARVTRIKHNDETSNPRQLKFLQVVAAVLPSPAQSFKTCSNVWTQLFLVLCWITIFLSRARRRILPSSEVLVEKENAADLILLKHSRQGAFNQQLAQLQAFSPQPLYNILSVLALQPETGNKGLLSIGGRLSKANLNVFLLQFLHENSSVSALQPGIYERGLSSRRGRQRKAKQKHSELLRANRSTNLLIQYNLKLMQAEPTLGLLHLYSQYFIPSTRRLARENCKYYVGKKSAKFQSTRDSLRLYMCNELETILCHAEACLNSRPLGVMTSHPVDGMIPLTPGHFLVGRALSTYPISKISHSPGPADRWDHCTKVTQNFWHRWSHEYLQQLQRAVKWHKPHKNFSVGDIVLLTEDETYQTQWITAKILAVYPGQDGVVRAVDLQLVHITKPDKWTDKDDFLNKLKKRISVSRRPVAKLSMLLAADELPDDYMMNIPNEDSGTSFQPPPACFVPT